MKVTPKKHLGQHFLTDPSVSAKLAAAIQLENIDLMVEVGPGTGALTTHLLKHNKELHVFEVDHESVVFLGQNFPGQFHIHEFDFLRAPLDEIFDRPFVLAGNFPYNISSQILFKMYENKQLVPEMVGMFQKEVAERIASGPGSKKYGILSVLLQAFYNIEYLFTVPPEKFDPPPKVDSGVIRMVANGVTDLGIDLKFFKRVVKTAFNQRRKTLRNSLKSMTDNLPEQYKGLRPEQLSVDDFVSIAKAILKEVNPG